jgi:outer membrane biosynthesis protein TonB
MDKKRISKEEREGVIFSLALHGLLFVLALFIFVGNEPQRFAYLEVTIGDFKDGTQSEFSLDRPEKVSTNPNPSPTDPIDPKPIDELKPVPETKVNEVSKPVEAPKQIEKVENDIIKTPETTKVNPERNTDRQRQEVKVPPRTQQADTRQEGVIRSGDIRGTTGQANTDQGAADDPTKSAPFSLEWEGDIVRAPQSQPLPNYVEEVEAVISVRFQVMPDGRVNQIIPLRKMSPALEKEIMTTLRSWRFAKLPSGVPQEPQWGTITFRFVLN